MTSCLRDALCLLGAATLTLAPHDLLGEIREGTPSGKQAPAADARHPVSTPRFDALAKEVSRAVTSGHLDQGIALYERALKQDPGWLEAHWALATLLYDVSRYEPALTHFKVVVKAQPDNGTALAFQGLCRAMLGEREQAVLDLRRAIELGIGVPRVATAARYHAAVLTNQLGDPDGAFEILRALAGEDEDSPLIINAFGVILLRLPWSPEDIPPDKQDMIRLAGRAGYDMGRARRSSVGYLAIEELVSRYPDEPNVHFAYGMFLLPDDPAAAIEQFRQELRVSPNHYVAMIQLALAELRRGRAQEALPFAEKAASLAPDVPASHVALGRALLALGQIDRAIAEMEAAVKLAPEIPRLHYSLAQAYRHARRREDAMREMREFQALQATTGATEEQEDLPPDVPPPPADGNTGQRGGGKR